MNHLKPPIPAEIIAPILDDSLGFAAANTVVDLKAIRTIVLPVIVILNLLLNPS